MGSFSIFTRNFKHMMIFEEILILIFIFKIFILLKALLNFAQTLNLVNCVMKTALVKNYERRGLY